MGHGVLGCAERAEAQLVHDAVHTLSSWIYGFGYAIFHYKNEICIRDTGIIMGIIIIIII